MLCYYPDTLQHHLSWRKEIFNSNINNIHSDRRFKWNEARNLYQGKMSFFSPCYLTELPPTLTKKVDFGLSVFGLFLGPPGIHQYRFIQMLLWEEASYRDSPKIPFGMGFPHFPTLQRQVTSNKQNFYS